VLGKFVVLIVGEKFVNLLARQKDELKVESCPDSVHPDEAPDIPESTKGK